MVRRRGKGEGRKDDGENASMGSMRERRKYEGEGGIMKGNYEEMHSNILFIDFIKSSKAARQSDNQTIRHSDSQPSC